MHSRKIFKRKWNEPHKIPEKRPFPFQFIALVMFVIWILNNRLSAFSNVCFYSMARLMLPLCLMHKFFFFSSLNNTDSISCWWKNIVSDEHIKVTTTRRFCRYEIICGIITALFREKKNPIQDAKQWSWFFENRSMKEKKTWTIMHTHHKLRYVFPNSSELIQCEK